MDSKKSNLPDLTLDKDKANALITAKGVETLDHADNHIKSNFILQISGFVVMIILFFMFRKKSPWVYYPNIKNKPLHPCYESNPGIVSWLYKLIVVRDTQLLSMIGLDGFMLLQTIKLLYRICFIVSAMCLPIFIYAFFYAERSLDDSQLFPRLTIWRIKDCKLYWGILLISYVSTIIIFYIIFIYYKRYITLRQLYLVSPATMTSIVKLKEISKNLGSNESSVEYINVSGRTILIDRLPNEISDDKELMKYMTSLGIGEIESVSLVFDTVRLQSLYEKRDSLIRNIEKEFDKAFCSMKAKFAENDKSVKESFGDLHSDDLEKSATILFKDTKLATSEKVRLLNNFMRNGDLFLSKTWMQKAALGTHFDDLKEVNNEISEEKKRIKQSSIKEGSIEIPSAEATLYTDSDVKHDVSFFSFDQIFNFKENKDYFAVSLPVNRKRAFVTFKDKKVCGISKQTMLGSKAFSSNIEEAPAPDDVLWRNITKPEIRSFFFCVVSEVLFILLNLAFLYVVTILIDYLQIRKDSKNQFLGTIFGKYAGKALGIYKSIIGPLIYNILLFLVPLFLKMLIYFEDTYSSTGLQSKLLYRLSLFLFFNGFFGTFVSYLVLNLLRKPESNDIGADVVFSELGKSIIQTSVFFLNTIIQRMCIGSAMIIFKPVPFVINFIISPMLRKTRREVQENRLSPAMNFGSSIPEILFIVPMALTYSCICPIIILLSTLFYWFSYLIYKNELLYATRNDYESGGTYWQPSIRFIMFSVVSFQFSTAMITFSSGNRLISLLFSPMIFFTLICTFGIEQVFLRASYNFPMNAPEEKFLDYFSKKVMEERFKLLNEWKEIGEEEDQDIVPIKELGFEDEDSIQTDSFYKDPCMLFPVGHIILSAHFFIVLHFIMSFDKNNVFKLKN